MWIMISGPYRHGTDNPDKWDENHRKLNEIAIEVYLRGYTPIVGVNVALPLIQAEWATKYDELMMPICLSVAERCDAVLRVGGPSAGADAEVEVFKKKGKPIFYSLDEIPAKTKQAV